jgi:hypothetical protein
VSPLRPGYPQPQRRPADYVSASPRFRIDFAPAQVATCTIASHRRGLAGATLPAVRGDILPKADSERSATCVAIPEWMKKSAPGAADAARDISGWALSEAQQQRLARLIDKDTKSAWQTTNSQAKRKNLSTEELRQAHHELMWEAFRAADFPPIGHSEIEQAKAKLEQIGKTAQRLAREIREVGTGAPQLYGLWNTYRSRRPDDGILAQLPDSLPSIATALDVLADFFRLAAPRYKPEGPVPAVDRPNNHDALRTVVIRRIELVCRQRFGATLSEAVAALANAALDRHDIDRWTVRGSLKPRKKVRKSKCT